MRSWNQFVNISTKLYGRKYRKLKKVPQVEEQTKKEQMKKEN